MSAAEKKTCLRLRLRQDARWDRLLEYGYLGLTGVVTLMAFIDTTMLTYEQVGWMYSLVPWVRLLLLLFTGAKLARSRPWRWEELLLALAVCGALLRSWQRVERAYVLETALLIAGARGIDFKKIAKVWFAVCAAALLATMALALTGVIENLVYTRRGRTRMSFGIIYPTDFSAHVFFLGAAWAWIRERHLTYWEIGGIAVLGLFCLLFCDARNSALCLFLLAAGLLYLRLRRRRSENRGEAYEMACPVQWALAVSAPAFAVFIILLSRIYDSGSGWMAALNKLLSTRLSLSHEAFQRYAVNLFGQDVYMNGWGGTTSAVGEYFFLDSSYVNLLFCFGLVTLVCLLAAAVYAALREKRLRAWEHLGILAVAALHCMVEHHMVELTYNLFLLLPLAASLSQREQDMMNEDTV